MEDIVLIIIACCLLFGAEKTKKGIGVVLKVIGIGILILIGLSFLGSFIPDTDQTSDVVQEQQEEYNVVTVEELRDALTKGYDFAKEQYNGKKVSVTGMLGTQFEEFGLDVMPYLTSVESSADDEQYWLPCLVDSDEVSQEIVSKGEGAVVTLKGVLWVANHDDFGIEVDSDNPDEFAITLMVESVE